VGYHHSESNAIVTSELQNLIEQLEADPSLFDPDRLLKRIEALDALDAYAGIPEEEMSHRRTSILARAIRLRARLEAANALTYNSIRHQIQQGNPPSQLRHWIEQCGDTHKSPQPGLGYDVLDELISGVLEAREPHTPPLPLPPEMVFYQPTPARHVLQFIRLSGLSPSDILIDLGSGLGHVAILASILTGAQCIGIETQQAYVASARACAAALHLTRVTFTHQNAMEANLSAGNVFYLYTPFTGNTLKAVLQNLREQSAQRTITICTLGPCTTEFAAQHWLTPISNPDPNQISIFRSISQQSKGAPAPVATKF